MGRESATMKTDPKVDSFLKEADKWQEETAALRRIVLECQLTEALKWGKPCYTFEGSNVVIIQGFREHCSLLFFKGALLDDSEGVLVRPGGNSRTGRRIDFSDLQEVHQLESTIKAYIGQAVEAEKSGLTVEEGSATAR